MKKKQYIVPAIIIVKLPARRVMVIASPYNTPFTLPGNNDTQDEVEDEDPNGSRGFFFGEE